MKSTLNPPLNHRVGYQEAVLHTAALGHLLQFPGLALAWIDATKLGRDLEPI